MPDPFLPDQAHLTHRDGTVFQVLIACDDFPLHLGWDEAATAAAYRAYEAQHPAKPPSWAQRLLRS